MKKRYTLYLSSAITGGATNELLTFNYDLRTLIPVDLREKHFLLSSEFHTNDYGNTPHSGIAVSINLPQSYNKSFPSQPYVLIGIGTPLTSSANNGVDTTFSYAYVESCANVKMINYPEVFPIKIFLESVNAQNLPANEEINLTLVFEECEDY